MAVRSYLSKLIPAVFFAVVLTPVAGSASILSDVSVELDGISPVGINANSYDGSGFDAFVPFTGATNDSLLAFNSFTFDQTNTSFQVTLLSEVAAYDGSTPGLSNSFGLLNSQGNFETVFDSATAEVGDSFVYDPQQGEQYSLALKSPEATFSSDSTENPDGAMHLLGMEVKQSGQVTIKNANLSGASVTFDLLAGDMILFIEDMLARGNSTSLVPDMSDFDFNDMVVVVRQVSKPIPEPATMMLMGLGLLGGAGVRRKRKLDS